MEQIKIILRHLNTPIFFVIIGLSLVLLSLGEHQDALFVISAISINLTLGIIQEIRARHKLRQLELMSAPKAKRLVDGKIQEVNYKNLRPGDVILLELGDEVPADGEIVKNKGLECDESMLTGESVAVKKQLKDKIYASSAVVAGSAEVLVAAVGDTTRVGAMSAKLKNYDPQITPLQRSIARSIQYFTILAIVLGLSFAAVYYQRQVPLVELVKTLTTAAVSVVPEGLLLASTVFLAYGSLRLTQARVLPQKLSAIEGMALLDVLCVDKTGTLTSPKISFHSLTLLQNDLNKRKLERLLGILARESGTTNATSEALAEVFHAPFDYMILENLPFSSARKMSGVKLRFLFNTYNIIMGAPEYVAKVSPISARVGQKIQKLTAQGLRVLLVAELPSEASLKAEFLDSARPLALVSLSNELRHGVKETVDFMQANGISIRVISGDNPETVSYIAKQAGIKAAHKSITGVDLAKIKVNSKAWDNTILGTTIFARVLPEQKEKIIATFQKQGLYTGMVGDGVNDALALKTADLGVAMSAGASTSKRISDLVLLDNAFTALPLGMKLGSQIMLSIEMVACLAFHKIIFGIALSILTMLFGLPYPFLPRHLTFMNVFLLTLPTIIITIFTPVPTLKINPKFFWRDTLGRIAPIALLSASGIFLSFLTVYLFARHGVMLRGGSTLAVLVATFFGMYTLYLTNLMFRTKQTNRTKLAIMTYLVCSSIVVLFSFGLRFARNFFDFDIPSATGALIALALVAVIAVVQLKLALNRRLSAPGAKYL